MALREISLGDDSELITGLCEWLVNDAREQIVTLQHHFEDHNPGKKEPVHYIDAYRPVKDERGCKARVALNCHRLIFPETTLSNLRIDKLIIIRDVEEPTGKGRERTRQRVAIVILRWPDHVFPERDVVMRFRITFVEHFTENNNRWPDKLIVERLGQYSQVEEETQEVLAQL